MAEELESHERVQLDFYISLKAGLDVEMGRMGSIFQADLDGFDRRRKLSWFNFRVLVKVARAFMRFRREMAARPPDVAIGFGGYASFPSILAAISLGVPAIIHEQNAIPSMTNRLLYRFSSGIGVAFSESLAYFKGKRVEVVGNPVRFSSSGLPPREEALHHFGLEENLFTLAILGGSQGAHSINQAVKEALPLFAEESGLQIVHGVGRDKYEVYMREMESRGILAGALGRLIYRPYPFIERMDLLYRVADLVVSRAGASTLAEITSMGLPSILIPFPHAAAGHQEANAMALEKRGAALVIKDNDISGEKLYEEVSRLMRDKDRLLKMAECSLKCGEPQSSRKLAEFALELSQERRR